jgi:hypothetical protein
VQFGCEALSMLHAASMSKTHPALFVPIGALECVYLTDTKPPSSAIVKFANLLQHNLVCRWPKEKQRQKGRTSQPKRSRLLLQPMVHQARAVLQPPVKVPKSEEDRQTRRCAKRILKLSSSGASVSYSRDTCRDHITTGQAL